MEQTVQVVEKWFEALGTVNYIKIFGDKDEAILQLAINRVNEIEERMSTFLPNSDISRINSSAGYGMVKIHTDTLQVLKEGLWYASLSKGAFDLTIRPLVELWGIGKKADYIPTQEKICSILPLVNYQDLMLNEKEECAGLRASGQRIDLGGIAKGYAADEVKRILKENHITDALINLGGNVLTMGQNPDNEYWRIGVQNPLAPTGEYLGILNLTEKTIVTSGSNERFFIKDRVRYHHILDTRTGYPARSGLLSVTVVADDSMDADALTTCLFIMGMEEGLDFLQQFQVEAIFITENLEVYLTDGLLDCFRV
jgi:FAD:protein FMN transferase